jgi:hypothetical protein
MSLEVVEVADMEPFGVLRPGKVALIDEFLGAIAIDSQGHVRDDHRIGFRERVSLRRI